MEGLPLALRERLVEALRANAARAIVVTSAQEEEEEDLLPGVTAFEVRVPPLRERPEQIEELATEMLRVLCARTGRAVPQLTREQVRALSSAPWPGNARELNSCLERALLWSPGRALRLPVLPRGLPPRRKGRRRARARRGRPGCDRGRSRAERRQDLPGADGAAAALGLKPSTLQSKMLKLGIERAAFER